MRIYIIDRPRHPGPLLPPGEVSLSNKALLLAFVMTAISRPRS